MTKDDFLKVLVRFKTYDKGKPLKMKTSILVRELFFLKRAQQTMAINWSMVDLIFQMSKRDVVGYLTKYARNDKLSFPLLISPLEYEDDLTKEEIVMLEKFFTNLSQDYIETEGRFKGKRWGKIRFRLYEQWGKLVSKQTLQAIATASEA